jgi:hypothetical protein
MTDYAAAPVQPIVQGLLSVRFVDSAGILSFFGVGIVLTGVNAPLYVGAGHYVLTLDPGLPGDVAIDPPFGRTLLTVRGPVGGAAGTPTIVESKSINYIVNAVPGVGANKIEIFLTDSADDGADPETGLEIVLWRADAGVELVNANLIGPLFQNN